MISTRNTPYILLDCKKGRIRFPKQALEALTFPKYIRILINPSKALMCIQRCEKMCHEASRLSIVRQEKEYAEVYSPLLMHQLSKEYSWKQDMSHRFMAAACLDADTLVFLLNQPNEKTTEKNSSL